MTIEGKHLREKKKTHKGERRLQLSIRLVTNKSRCVFKASAKVIALHTTSPSLLLLLTRCLLLQGYIISISLSNFKFLFLLE